MSVALTRKAKRNASA